MIKNILLAIAIITALVAPAYCQDTQVLVGQLAKFIEGNDVRETLRGA